MTKNDSGPALYKLPGLGDFVDLKIITSIQALPREGTEAVYVPGRVVVFCDSNGPVFVINCADLSDAQRVRDEIGAHALKARQDD